MFASAGMLIPEGAISWEFQAEDEQDKKKYHGGFTNGKRKTLMLIHRRVGLERRGQDTREMGGERCGMHMLNSS